MATYTYTARMATNLAINTIIELVLTQGTQSVANNRTPFTYTIKIRRVNNWNDNFIGNADVTFTMGGTSVVSITNKWWSIHGDTITKEYTLASGSFNVYHDSNGKKTAAIYVRVDPNVSNAGASWGTAEVMTISKSLTLPTIPRATTITSVGNITTASTRIAVNVSRKTSSFTHSMNLYIGSTFIAEWSGSTANFNGSKTLPLDTTHRTRMLNAIKTSTSATGRFTVRTFSGSTTIGYSTKNITISVHSGAVPTLTSSKFTTTVETKYNLSGITKAILVQHAGTLSYSAPWVMATGASVKSRTTTFAGKSLSTSAGAFVSGSSGNQTITTKVTDSRGRSGSLSKTFNVLPYSPAKLEVAYVGRPRDTNTAKHYLEVELYLTVHDFNSENKYRVRIQTKETGTSAWSTAHTVNYSGGTSRVKRTYVPSQIYDETKSYDVRIILEDELSSATSVGVLGTANYTLVLGKTNIGVNMIPGSGKGLHVNGSIWDTNNGIRNLSDTVSDLTGLVNITGDFTPLEGVTNFYACKLGRLRFLRFDYQPTKTGFTQNVISTPVLKHRPLTITSVTVSTRYSTPDSHRGISSYYTTSGNLTVVTPEIPVYPSTFTCMYFAG